mmetsp:Transcript_53873/g.126304  ORF Transcript_53873/g.126304 Transcript_53873/m.126304 type:complete len:111 (+) Transcript_53873:1520-1852(+)
MRCKSHLRILVTPGLLVEDPEPGNGVDVTGGAPGVAALTVRPELVGGSSMPGTSGGAFGVQTPEPVIGGDQEWDGCVGAARGAAQGAAFAEAPLGSGACEGAFAAPDVFD